MSPAIFLIADGALLPVLYVVSGGADTSDGGNLSAYATGVLGIFREHLGFSIVALHDVSGEESHPAVGEGVWDVCPAVQMPGVRVGAVFNDSDFVVREDDEITFFFFHILALLVHYHPVFPFNPLRVSDEPSADDVLPGQIRCVVGL